MVKKRDEIHDADFDPAKLAEEAIEANLDPSIFDQIEEGDIRWPKNVIDWVRSKRFLNVTPFPRQIEICANFLGQFCPRCSDPALMEQDRWGGNLLLMPAVDYPLGEIWDRVSFLEDGVCPKCGVTKLELINKGELTPYINLNGCAGMRSSKTVIVGGLVGTYQVVRFLQLKSPSQFFGLMANQTLHATFVAITAGQAQETLWDAFKDRVDSAPWFKEYHAFLNEEAKRLGKDRFHNDKQTFLAYEHKQLIVSFCGPDIRTIRGRTRFYTGIDEKGWFDVEADKSSASGKIRLNAHQTHEALIKSLRTIRSSAMKLRDSGFHDPPDALNSDVSSPSSLNDAIMVGLREANEDPTIYPFHYATWEMNPNVPLSSLRHEMRNKRDFERDYAAVPPLGANQFIDNQPAVEKCQMKESQNRWISWTPRYVTDEFGDRTMYLEVKVLKREKNRPRLLTVDTGLTNNSYAIELWSYDREFQRPVCDIAIECMPEEKEGERILVNFPLMFEHAIVPLVKDFRVIMAAFDRWNSIDQVQRLRLDYKVEAIQYVLKWADFQAIRARLLDSSVRLPRMEMSIQDVRQSDKNFDDIVRNVPITHLVLQILTVREGGRKVIKPINGTDDLFRCLCLAVKFLLDPDYTKKFEQYGSGLGFGKASVGVYRSNRDQAVPQVRAKIGKRNQIGIRQGFRGKLT